MNVHNLVVLALLMVLNVSFGGGMLGWAVFVPVGFLLDPVFDRIGHALLVGTPALTPLWNVAGFALGAATALIGPKAAMACTAAIETEIDRHYGAQLDRLGEDDPELGETIREFRAEEVEHRETALAAGAEQAPAYPFLSAAIRLGCRIAIGLSERI